MPDLKQSLHGYDLGSLRIIAEQWGFELAAPDAKVALNLIVDNLLNQDLLTEVIEALPVDALHGLLVLIQNNGKLPWSQFTRQFGGVREMGPGRRDRERPDRRPDSPGEVLWYHAFIGRAFFDSTRGTEEFAYIPDDLLSLIPNSIKNKKIETSHSEYMLMGRGATAAEHQIEIIATDLILDHCSTYLAGLRIGIDIDSFEYCPVKFVSDLVDLAGIIDPEGVPKPENTRKFLELPRGEALALLVRAWLDSKEYNDLHNIPNLRVEGEWVNDPYLTRHFVINLLSTIPGGIWWSLTAFIADIYKKYPDFQRPAGDYDSWFIKDKHTGNYLRGFKFWNEVDGELIRYLITGPLHRLGIVDLGTADPESPFSAFRFSEWADGLLSGNTPPKLADENDQFHILTDGRINVPRLTPRTVRYQVARFCKWENETQYEYRYRLTPSSLDKAKQHGLRINHLQSLFRNHSDSIPPNIATALDRWDKMGTEVRIRNESILLLGSPELLQSLRNSHAARFLGDPLGPASIIVKHGSEEKVLAILSEMGFLGELVGGNIDDV